MIDLRIYRTAWLLGLAAVVVLMFSLEPVPDPVEGPISTQTFKGRETTRLARSIAETYPDRPAGSEGDLGLANAVEGTFSGISGGEVSRQDFEEDGQTLRNVLLTLPGQLDERLLIVANRDSPEGPGGTSSAASTAILQQLAIELGVSRHNRTIVLASTTGSSEGEAGVRELVKSLTESVDVEAAIVIENPGVERGQPPYLVQGRASDNSIPPKLLVTGEEIATTRFERPSLDESGLTQLARLALPVGTGASAALADEGIDAVAISSNGERTEQPRFDTVDAISGDAVFQSGSAALDLVLTLDEGDRRLPQGTESYVRLGDNMVPGWSMVMVALALLIPAALTSADILSRELRRDRKVARKAIPWAFERALVPLAAAVVVYLSSVAGLIDSPPFPYDPGRFEPGGSGVAALGLAAAAALITMLLIRPFRTPLDSEAHLLAAASGMVCVLGVAGIWLINPFLALLLTPVAHVWVLAARPQSPPRTITLGFASFFALAPFLIAAVAVSEALELGYDAPWHLLLLICGGHFSVLMVGAWTLLLGGILATIAATRARPPIQQTAPEQFDSGSVRGPGGYKGPGSLGGTPSAINRG